MRRATGLDRRIRILEGRIAALDPSITGDYASADARAEAEFAMECSERLIRTVRWGSVVVAGTSLLFAALTYLLS